MGQLRTSTVWHGDSIVGHAISLFGATFQELLECCETGLETAAHN